MGAINWLLEDILVIGRQCRCLETAGSLHGSFFGDIVDLRQVEVRIKVDNCDVLYVLHILDPFVGFIP